MVVCFWLLRVSWLVLLVCFGVFYVLSRCCLCYVVGFTVCSVVLVAWQCGCNT